MWQSLWSAYTLFFLGTIVQMYLANFSGIVVAVVYLVRSGFATAHTHTHMRNRRQLACGFMSS